MRISILILFLLLGLALPVFSQVNPETVTIVRDRWGVPHIYAPTDEGVAYGLAWATAEDDFATQQKQWLIGRGLAGEVYGREGAIMDLLMKLIDAQELVEERYDKDLSADFRQYLQAYADGANAYAAGHPGEILHGDLFPVSGKDLILSYVLGMTLMSNVQEDLRRVLAGEITAESIPPAQGSNAFAVSSKRTTDGSTFLALNSHQPLEGMHSWYEAHLNSGEGLNILGATFAGGVSIFMGTNAHLGWAHTLNFPDLTDVYRLQMHPTARYYYRFDGRWLKLEPHQATAHVKLLGFIKVGIKKKFFRSKYGVTLETPEGFFALRFPANRDIRAAEQWYRMNKATDWSTFRSALGMQALICTNIVYADREDRIFFISNGRFPKRNPSFNWEGIVPGDTSATLWADSYYPLDSLVQVECPASGYVYNCNNSPFLASGSSDNPDPGQVPSTLGYQPPDILTNRGSRFVELIEAKEKISFKEFKKIKFDRSYQTPLKAYPALEKLFCLSPVKYPELAISIRRLQRWDRAADENSKAASLLVLTLKYILEELGDEQKVHDPAELTESLIVDGLHYAQNYLKKYFGTWLVPLSKLQRHRRGNVDLPFGGAPDVMAAVYSRPGKDGRLEAVAGDSYIQLVRFTRQGPTIESINAYGASAKPGSPHYTDQMALFRQQKLKPMTLNREQVFREAEKIYHPGGAPWR